MHNIFGDRFIGRREPAWHGLGTTFGADELVTASEAVRRAGIDYQVDVVPAGFQVNGQWFESDRGAIVRYPTTDDPQYQLFGYASKEYQVIQNVELAHVLDSLCDEWPVETVGALGRGETTFFTLDAGGGQVGSEDIHQYFLISDNKTGTRSLRVAFTPVRVVCQNTLVSGLRAATVNAAIPHTPGAKADLDFRVQMMGQMRRAQLNTLQVMTAMTVKKLVDAQVEQVLLAAYPEPPRSAKVDLHKELTGVEGLAGFTPDQVASLLKVSERRDYYVDRASGFRDAARELFGKFNDEHPAYAFTAWAVWNAIVETEDYRRGSDSIGESALFGIRAAAKARAFQAATSV